jgi:hypothetical protein
VVPRIGTLRCARLRTRTSRSVRNGRRTQIHFGTKPRPGRRPSCYGPISPGWRAVGSGRADHGWRRRGPAGVPRHNGVQVAPELPDGTGEGPGVDEACEQLTLRAARHGTPFRVPSLKCSARSFAGHERIFISAVSAAAPIPSG